MIQFLVGVPVGVALGVYAPYWVCTLLGLV